jgi:Na+-driven multidrug efflux pump
MVNGSSEMIIESSVGITIFLFNLVALRFAGEKGVAALTIVLYVYFLLISGNIGFAAGVGPLISYYFGAKEFAKVNQFLGYSRNFILASSVAVFAVAMLAAPLITRIYVPPDSEVYGMAVRGIRFIAWAFGFAAANIFASSLFMAYANGKVSALIAINRGLIMIIVGLAILPLLFGFDGIWLTVIFAETVTMLLTLWLLRRYRPVYRYRL